MGRDHGRFRDVEAPKLRMLELDARSSVAASSAGRRTMPSENVDPILALQVTSPARASHADTELEDERYRLYESNPAPWWVAVIWVTLLVGGATYLVVNLSG